MSASRGHLPFPPLIPALSLQLAKLHAPYLPAALPALLHSVASALQHSLLRRLAAGSLLAHVDRPCRLSCYCRERKDDASGFLPSSGRGRRRTDGCLRRERGAGYMHPARKLSSSFVPHAPLALPSPAKLRSCYRTLERQRRLSCRGTPTPCGCPPHASRSPAPTHASQESLSPASLNTRPHHRSNRMAKRKVPPRPPPTPDELDFGRLATARAAAKLAAQRLVQPVPAIQQEDDDSDASDDSFAPSSARRSPTPTPSPAPTSSSPPPPTPARASPELDVFPDEQTTLDSTDPEDEIVVVSFEASAKKPRAYGKRRRSSSPSPGLTSGTKRPRPDKQRATTSRHRSSIPKTTDDIKPSPFQPHPASSAQSAVSSPTNVSSSFVVSTVTAATIAPPAANGSAAIHAEIAGCQTSLLCEGDRLAEVGLLGQLDAAADDAGRLFSVADFRAVTETIRAQRVAEEQETWSAEPQAEQRSWWSLLVAFLR